MGYRWQLRQLMASRGMFQTSRLGPLLAERGIHLSREQVYRLVAGTPQRLSLDVLAALCDILDCTPADLIVVEVTNTQVPKRAAGSASRARPSAQRTTIRRPDHGSGEPPDCAVQPLCPERAGGGTLAGRAGLLPLLPRRPGPVRRLLAVRNPGPSGGAH